MKTFGFEVFGEIIAYQGPCWDIQHFVETYLLDMPPVLLFSKLNKIFFGYFDPVNIFLDNENK